MKHLMTAIAAAAVAMTMTATAQAQSARVVKHLAPTRLHCELFIVERKTAHAAGLSRSDRTTATGDKPQLAAITLSAIA